MLGISLPKYRPFSYAHIYGIALPILLSSVAEQIVNITDTIVVGSINKSNLGAVGLGSLFYYTFVFIAVGLGMGVQIIIGRRNGARQFPVAGNVLNQSLFLFGFIAIILFILISILGKVSLRYMITDDEVYRLANEFVYVRRWGLMFICLSISFKMFYIGITKTSVITFTTIVLASVNLIFNNILVFGLYGFPAMGIAGSATASVIAEGSALVAFIIYSLVLKQNKVYELFVFHKPDFALFASIIKFGLPVMLQGWISVSSWFIFFISIEKMGSTALASSTVVKSIYLLSIIPVWAFGSASNTLVSNAIGAGKTKLIPYIIKRCLILGFITVFILIQVAYWVPDWLIGHFTNDIDVILNAKTALFIAVSASLLYMASFILLNVITGAGYTKSSLIIEAITLVIYLGYILVVSNIPGITIAWVWVAEIIYGLCMGLGTIFVLIRLKPHIKPKLI
ncbi:MAG: MATE family efflux transporter [Bacteroidota bacterium]|nr:MATE family efflux transporter [Bacteroidota bacterium]